MLEKSNWGNCGKSNFGINLLDIFIVGILKPRAPKSSLSLFTLAITGVILSRSSRLLLSKLTKRSIVFLLNPSPGAVNSS